MDLCMMKRVKGYLVWGLVFYTVLVTYFLVLSAWSDDLSVKKRQGDEKLINVLYQEERRHLRSFKDVVKSYGGMVGLKIRQKFNGESTGNTSGGDASLETGRNGRQFKSTDVFASEDGSPKNSNSSSSSNVRNSSSKSNNSTRIIQQESNDLMADSRLEKPRFTVEVETWEQAMLGKAYFQRRKNNNSDDSIVSSSTGGVYGKSNTLKDDNDNRANNNNSNIPYTGNIFIEDTVPNNDNNNNVNMNITGDGAIGINNKDMYKSVSNKKPFVKKYRKTSKVSSSSSSGGVKSSNNNTKYLHDGTETAYCDKIDAEEPHLCLQERLTLSHVNHVNITPTHMSFKPIGDLRIFSGFLDTRRKPAFIRFMAIAPKGRDSVKGSGYWCAFNLPAVLSQHFYWNGIKKPATASSDQATQLDYYAASVGHGKEFQFYIMSCTVPQRHLAILAQVDTSRIHLVTGSKKSPLLETVQERISVDVLNNRGLPLQEIIKKTAVLEGVFQTNNTNISNNNNNNNTAKHSFHSSQDVHQKTVISNDSNNTDNNPNNRQHRSVSLNSSRGRINPNAKASSFPSINPPPDPIPNSVVSCVAPISTASMTVVQMVEFVELTLQLGSQHIVLYTTHVSGDVKDVLAMYRRQGLVTILPWPVPNPSSIWANGRDVALNDCLYRTMHRFEFALFHDMDEFVVPRNTPDLPSFINFLYQKARMKRNRTSDIIFSSAYFAPPTKAQSQALTTVEGYSKDVSKFASLRSIHRTYFNQEHSLRMIRQVMAFRVGGGERKRTVFTISSRYAAVNHYAKCVGSAAPKISGLSAVVPANKTDTKPPAVDCSAKKLDMHIWRIKDRLIRQTKDSIRELNSNRRG